MKKVLCILLICAGTLLGISCSKKSNPIGFNTEYSIQDTLSRCIKFEYSKVLNNNNYFSDYSSSRLTVGTLGTTETRSLLQWKTFPKETWLDTVSISECTLNLYTANTYDSTRAIQISAYQLGYSWKENTVTADSLWDEYSTEIGTTSFNADSICFIPIDTEIITTWIREDTTRYGLLLKANACEDNFAEFYSSEHKNYPRINIIFEHSSRIDTLTLGANHDTFVAKDSTFIENKKLDVPYIANLYPTQSIFSINLAPDSLGLTSEEFEKITINKAVLEIDSTAFTEKYLSEEYLKVKPYYIIDTSDYVIRFIPGCGTEEIFSTTQKIELNITGIVQAYTRQSFSDNLFTIRSVTETKNYSFLAFATPLKLRLKLTYTKPIL